MEKISILFVCMGNICRSPTAEGVARLLIERAGFANRVAKLDSAGTHGAHAGEAPDPRATRMAASRGYDLSRLRARQVSPKDFVTFDHVVAMDRVNLRYLQKLCPEDMQFKLGLMMSYAPEVGIDEVPDPYYGGDAGFERVLDLIEAATEGLIANLFRPR